MSEESFTVRIDYDKTRADITEWNAFCKITGYNRSFDEFLKMDIRASSFTDWNHLKTHQVKDFGIVKRIIISGKTDNEKDDLIVYDKTVPYPNEPFRLLKEGEALRTSNSQPKKERVDLIPREFIRDLGLVLGHNMGMPDSKYPENNWLKGMKWRICIASFERHWTAWQLGEKLDAESGQHHLMHAICNLMFLYFYEKWNLGTDDRIKESDYARPS